MGKKRTRNVGLVGGVFWVVRFSAQRCIKPHLVVVDVNLTRINLGLKSSAGNLLVTSTPEIVPSTPPHNQRSMLRNGTQCQRDTSTPSEAAP